MKKRLMVGLMAGGLTAAMLPGVATATPGNPAVLNTGQCVAEGVFVDRAANPATGAAPAVINKNKVNSPAFSAAAAKGKGAWAVPPRLDVCG